VERAGRRATRHIHTTRKQQSQKNQRRREKGEIERTGYERPLGIEPGERRDCETPKSVDVAEMVEE